jgi:TDG/mug DNA glycosylase family protein
MDERDIRLKGLKPVIDQKSHILILGTFPSELSLKTQQYYANPRNHFWEIMDQILDVPITASYHRRISLLRAQGVGLWDVIESCTRPGSSDDAIRDDVPNDIIGLLSSHPGISYVALNGRIAEVWMRTLLREKEFSDKIIFEYLPSTSPANTRYSKSEKVKIWSRIKLHLN